MATKKDAPTWSDVKVRLAEFDRAELLGLVQDLYAASKENKAFLHTRFGLGGDVLKSYMVGIDRWLWPDVLKNQDVSVAKAKKAIADYKKAIGQTEGLAELMVYFCERASGFAGDVGMDDESYFNALVRMFEQALKLAVTLSESHRAELLARLDSVRDHSHNIGYGVGDEMDELLAKNGIGV